MFANPDLSSAWSKSLQYRLDSSSDGFTGLSINLVANVFRAEVKHWPRDFLMDGLFYGPVAEMFQCGTESCGKLFMQKVNLLGR
jgi:hypothetical protein